jgi:membrane protein implicated in regulation of membrane protease activity
MSASDWLWIWVGVAVVFAFAELITPFVFFMLSFTVGAVVAGISAALDVGVAMQIVLFAAGSIAALAVLVPVGLKISKVDSDVPQEGSRKWIGRMGVVLEKVPRGPHATGLVRVERGEWRAETDGNRELPKGATIKVLAMRGTRLVVEGVEWPDETPNPSTATDTETR